GEAAAAEIVRGWSGMTIANLRKAVLGAFAGEPPTPFSGTARLRPLGSLAEIRTAGQRYRNCLREDLSYLAEGDYAYFEWLGPPGAVVELVQDRVTGWRFEQARLARN
ncbi:MAG TPA: hypothetical protein VIO94_13645, partial [Phenylobacterium sp.]